MDSPDPKFANLVRDSDEDFIRQLYAELKKMAHGKLASERAGMTINTTGLVHEVWLRLEKSSPPAWRDRPQFFAAAAEAMRRILVEAARKRLAAKRGGGAEMVPLDDVEPADIAADERLLGVHEVLDQLEQEDPYKAQIVKLRFFSGMEYEEIASLLGVNEKTVRRHWEMAKIWLYRSLSDPR